MRLFIISVIVALSLSLYAAPPRAQQGSPLKIVCVGDSITAGAGIQDPGKNGYPARLQAYLGTGYEVHNCGVSGRTMQKAGDYPYWKEEAFARAQQLAPQVVLIMLGTNDSKPQNWKNPAGFSADTREMVETFRKLPCKPRVCICLPVPVFKPDQWGIRAGIVQGQILPILRQVAYDLNVDLINLHTPLLDSGKFFPDTVHPNAEGADLMANMIARHIRVPADDRFSMAGKLPANAAKSNFYGYSAYDFVLNGRNCKIVVPKQADAGHHWAWRTEFFGHEPQTDLALLENGFHIAFIDTYGLNGSPLAKPHWEALYDFAVKAGLDRKPVMMGFSRGGLYAYNWAIAHPDRVSCIYGDAPVMDIRSWPGGKGKGKGSPSDWKTTLSQYGLTETTAAKWQGPMDQLKRLARAKIPIIHVVGDADTVVPVAENTAILEERYRKLGGTIEVIHKPGCEHHPHSLPNPTPVVQFILDHVGSVWPQGESSVASVTRITSVRRHAEEQGIPYPAALDAASISETQISDLSREALPIGNGDLNALLWERNGTLCLRVAKNDVWDARIDTSADPSLLKVDLPSQKWSGGGGLVPSWGMPYPSPRCAAIVRIGGGSTTDWSISRAGGKVNEWKQKESDSGVMVIEGNAGASAGFIVNIPLQTVPFSRLQFKISGTPGAQYYVTLHTSAGVRESGWKDSPATEETATFSLPTNTSLHAVEMYVMTKTGGRAENHIRDIALVGGGAPLVLVPGNPPSRELGCKLDIRRAVATAGDVRVRALAARNVFLIETDKDVSLEEIRSGSLPPAQMGDTDGVKWLHMKMPGDKDYAGMEYALAVAGNGNRKVVAVVTSRDTARNVREAAVKLARSTVKEDLSRLVAKHEAEWTRYWSASGVQLNDPDFQVWWYRMTYMLRCFSKPGVVPAGLWAFQPTDAPSWHGDYHHNYNSWQPYWAPLILNHPDQTQPWVDYMNAMLPRLKWFAKETYDCEGAFIGISSFAYEPDPAKCQSKNKRQIGMVPWGYTMGMIGMSSQILWWHHLYQPDRDYFRKKIYPVIRETALFFCSFAEKCPRDANGKVKYGPSYSPEHGGFGVHNVPFDLAYARFSLNAGIAGAEELGRDRELVTRFRKALDLLPDYPTAPDADGKPVVVDWAGCTFRQIGEHNIVVPDVPVFPGDQVTWFSPDAEKELFRSTMRQTRHRGCNSTVMLSVAKARLGMPEAIDDLRNYYKPQAQPNGMFYWPLHGFYLAESVGIAAGVSEFLLQSVDSTIRVFPCWPKDKDASFTRLRAQGGFLVSAEQKDGNVVKLEIISTVGGKLRLLDPWTGKIVERDTKSDETISFIEKKQP